MKTDPTPVIRRRIVRVTLVICVLAVAYLFWTYGTWRVIQGMDTMFPDLPAGSTCVIQKRPSSVLVGKVVILEVGDGAGLVTRVHSIEGDKIRIRHDNRGSRFLQYEKRDYTIDDVRGLVLGSFTPSVEPDTRGSGEPK